MAQTITVIPQLVTSADANNEVLTISTDILSHIETPILQIEVVSGTFKFAAGQDASNSSASYTDGEKTSIPVRKESFRKAEVKLNFKAGAGSQTFRVTAI